MTLRGRSVAAGDGQATGADAASGTVLVHGAELVVENLHKRYHTQEVLCGVSLSLPAGSLTAILGPSGSGKTTLLRVLAGFERADAGRVIIDGATVDDGNGTYVAPEHRRIGYVPQEGALFPHLTVARNVAFGMSREWRQARAVTRLLTMVGMKDMGRRYPHELSGGQQQRVALARAIAVGPTLVLLDEPFSSLDASLRASMRADVRRVLHRIGATALLVTHDQDEALSWADQVAVIDGGRIAQFDSPQALYTHPADPALARFVGDANLLTGTVQDGMVVTALGPLAVAGNCPAEGTAAVVLVRPEQVVLAPLQGPAPGSGNGNDSGDDGSHGRGGPAGAAGPGVLSGEGGPLGQGVPAVVTGYEYFGHDAVVRVALVGPEDWQSAQLEVVARVAGGAPWAPGTKVRVAVRGAVRAWPQDHPGVTTRV